MFHWMNAFLCIFLVEVDVDIYFYFFDHSHNFKKPAAESCLQVVLSNTELSNLNYAGTDYLLGLFAETHVEYEDARKTERDPSLTDMVDGALKVIKFILTKKSKKLN